MFRLVVLCVLSCTVEGFLRKPAGSDVADKLEAVERKSTPVFQKVAQEMQLVAKELEQGTTGKNKTEVAAAMKKATANVANVKKEFEAVKKEFDAALHSGKKNDTEFPWWANASAGNLPNLTQTKTEKVEKFPWWANASAGMPNFTQTKTQKAPKDATKKDEKFPWWTAASDNMPNLTQTKKNKAPKDEKDKKLPWWANATAGNLPNLTQTKTEKAEKFPWWANATSGNMPNLTQVKTEKAPMESKDAKAMKEDKKFPWWANASAGAMPNLTQTKTEKAPKDATEKNKKFPWWANASAGNLPNFTQITKDLPKNLPKGQPAFADLGPFASKEDACDYCFTSNTRTSVVPNCICTAYDGDSGPTMFCTASAAGVKYVADKGGCKCVENNPSAMGKTTCDPF